MVWHNDMVSCVERNRKLMGFKEIEIFIENLLQKKTFNVFIKNIVLNYWE